jgi:hypothetical protein
MSSVNAGRARRQTGDHGGLGAWFAVLFDAIGTDIPESGLGRLVFLGSGEWMGLVRMTAFGRGWICDEGLVCRSWRGRGMLCLVP